LIPIDEPPILYFDLGCTVRLYTLLAPDQLLFSRDNRHTSAVMSSPTLDKLELAVECLTSWAEKSRRSGERQEQAGRDSHQRETEEITITDELVRRLLRHPCISADE
jgi:hypothetical protein